MFDIFAIAILIMSVVLHEVSHGYAAYAFGDATAKYEGRLTLNPIKHLDLFGSILLPAILILTNAGFILGWAKPVPYNPYNLRNRKLGELVVASAGIISNIFLAVFFGLIIRVLAAFDMLSPSFVQISAYVVLINLVLAIFNLIPIPPLDGSKIFFSFLPDRFNSVKFFLERYGFILILVFILFFWQYLSPLIFYLTSLIVGF